MGKNEQRSGASSIETSLLDIHAIFTITLQLPIQSVPASLRGKPEANKAG